MRTAVALFVAIPLAIVLLLPVAAPAAAQSGAAPCQTINGPKWLADMLGELLRVGYDGPRDPNSVGAAYARTSGGFVSCADDFSSRTSGGRLAVMYLGGVRSSLASADQDWAPIVQRLLTRGFRNGPGGDLFTFNYAPPGPDYDATCQPLASSARALADGIRQIRDGDAGRYSGIVLIGHSLGGVLAFLMLNEGWEVQPFVRGVITVDSPLQGLTPTRAAWGEFLQGPCQAVEDLAGLGPLWPQQLRQTAQMAMDRGTRLMAVVNESDCAVPPGSQGIGDLPIHWNVRMTVGGFCNHSAVLHNREGIAGIADWIGPQR